jgi:adenosylcobalamin-dependent ribonucleoside-diphosphate reductase
MAKLTDNAIKVLERRYLQKDEKDLTKVIETPEDLFRRVAHTVAQADAKDFIKTDDTEISVTEYVKDTEDTFFNMLNNLEFLPNSPTLMNAGRRLGQLSACFVLPVNNTVEEILKTIKNTAIIHKSGGGTGFNFSHVKLDPVLPASYRPIFVLSGLHTDIDSFKAAEFSHCDKWALPDSIIEFPYDDSYVVIDDNMESIFTLDVLLKQPKYIIFSKVRPAKSIVHATNGEASGPVSFMSVWNEAVRFLTNQITPITTIRLMNMCTEVVKQGGTRRGANMGIVNADCEYIEEFVNCKEDNDEINNFNLSVGIVDGFWKSYINNTSAVDQSKKVVWGLKNYATGDMVRAIDPVTFMNNVIDHAWCNGEPGIIFLDKINAKNPIKTMQVESTNPCGEQPLLPYEACNLGSINLKEMLTVENGKYVLDEAKLENTVYSAVHFLDNVIEVNKYPIPEIDATTRKFRKIGLGVMAWADMLYLMNIAYNSDEAIKMAKRVSGLIQEYAHKASETLGMIRGSFSGILETIYSDDPNISYMRNATTTTIAPTGTISIIASVSSGIEPQFAISYIRIAMDEDELAYVNPIFKNALLKATGWTEQDDIYKQVMIKVAKEGSVVHIDEIPEEIKRVFVTAHDIDVSWHIQHQAAWQENTDNAVSKTINMLNSATREDVREAYNLARSTNCKGTTIYRDGSRESQVLNVGSKKEKNDHTTKTITETIPRTRLDIPKIQVSLDTVFELTFDNKIPPSTIETIPVIVPTPQQKESGMLNKPIIKAKIERDS